MSSFKVEVMNGPFAVNQFNVDAEDHLGALCLALDAASNSPSEPLLSPGDNYPEGARSIQIAVWEDPDMEENIRHLERIKEAVDKALSKLKAGGELTDSPHCNDLIMASNLLDDIAQNL